MNTQNIITPFEFEDKLVRTVEVNGQLGWLTADLAKALGFSNIRATINTFPENEKGVINSDTLGGPQEMTYLTEPGLYRLIFRSNLPAAERFQTFVFHEVLPSIRKRGFYSHRTDQLLSFVRELMDMGATFKEASILARGEFPPLLPLPLG